MMTLVRSYCDDDDDDDDEDEDGDDTKFLNSRVQMAIGANW